MNQLLKIVRSFALIVTACVGVWPVAAQTRTGGYMKIVDGHNGIAGEATDPDHGGWISLASVKVDATSTPDKTKKQTETITMTRLTDRSSQGLMVAAFTGRTFKEVLIDYYEPASETGGARLAHLKLAKVSFTAVSSGSADGLKTITEIWAIKAAKIEAN